MGRHPDLDRHPDLGRHEDVSDLASMMQNRDLSPPMEEFEGIGGPQAPSIDLFAILRGMLRRWKLVAAITLCTMIATYGVVKLVVPKRYKSTVEILVFDPQQQIDATVQKPISPFVEAVGNDAISTEINILKSKAVALRVATELGLDTDPDFQPREFRIGDLAQHLGSVAQMLGLPGLAERLGAPTLAEWLRFANWGQGDDDSARTADAKEEKAEKLDRAADALIKRLDIWQDSYIIFVSATSRDPVKAQRLASSIANDYLASQREARQEALEHVAVWLKSRVDNLQSRVSETEASIEELTAKSGIHDTESDKVREQQIRDLSTQLMTAREEVSDKSAHLDQARHLIDAHGDIDSIAEFTASPALTELRRKKMELKWSLADLQNKLGEHNPQVVSTRAALASVDAQIGGQAETILGGMKNAYDIAMRQEKSLEASLNSLTANVNSEAYAKSQQLRRSAEADQKNYETYLSQYNYIAEQREMQAASARIISPATLPRSPSTARLKFYALGGIGGLGGGLLIAFLLEYMKPGIRTSTEIEQSFGMRVVGFVPFVQQRKARIPHHQTLNRMVNEPFSHLSEAMHAMRIGLELSSARPKVVLITSALPGEGKSTTAMLLAASSASAGKRTVLLDCDLRMRSTSEALQSRDRSGLSELLRGEARLEDVIIEDPVTKISVIPAGAMVGNAADVLMSQDMADLMAVLRGAFDYIVMDGPPLLPVVDALALATAADKILVIVEWGQTPRNSIREAFRVLGPEASRVAGVVLNKVDFSELPGYGGYQYYRSVAKYYHHA
ncbi:MAG TPA: polysaccharide biosynthesis tyrosine autokinase [Roseiarcus sp.]